MSKRKSDIGQLALSLAERVNDPEANELGMFVLEVLSVARSKGSTKDVQAKVWTALGLTRQNRYENEDTLIALTVQLLRNEGMHLEDACAKVSDSLKRNRPLKEASVLAIYKRAGQDWMKLSTTPSKEMLKLM